MALPMHDCPVTRYCKMQQANVQNKHTMMSYICSDMNIAHPGILETLFALPLPNNVVKDVQNKFAASTLMRLWQKAERVLISSVHT